MVGIYAGNRHLMGNIGRAWTTGAFLGLALVVTVTAEWWVTGPGITAPLNGYRFPVVDFDQSVGFAGGSHASMLLVGWGTPESWGVRSNRAVAELAFRLPIGAPLGERAVLRLHLNNAPLIPRLLERRLMVWIGQAKLGDVMVAGDAATLVFQLNGLTLRRDPEPIVLKLESSAGVGLVSFDIDR